MGATTSMTNDRGICDSPGIHHPIAPQLLKEQR